jgi:hypothetical protein
VTLYLYLAVHPALAMLAVMLTGILVSARE